MAILLKLILSFLFGGALCALAQVLIDKTKLTPARILVGYVVAGVLLSAIGLYAPLAELAGAGVSTPLSGFGHLIAKGVREAVDQKGLLGAFSGGLSAAAAGTAVALCAGLLAAAICHGGKPRG
jgi:stage V sporulation protein AE